MPKLLTTGGMADELPLIDEWFSKIGEKLPTSMRDELETHKQRLDAS